jgi:hypothetical protein
VVQTVAIAGYTRPIEQPFLGQLDGQPVLAKMGDGRLQLTNEQLRGMGDEAARIVSALARCAAPFQFDCDSGAGQTKHLPLHCELTSLLSVPAIMPIAFHFGAAEHAVIVTIFVGWGLFA